MGSVDGRRLIALGGSLAAALSSAQLPAQVAPDEALAQLESLEDEYGHGGEEAAEEDFRLGPARPWTLQMRLPVDWRSNLTLAETNLRSGATIGPDLSVSRRWTIGGWRLFTEAGAFSQTVLRDAARDSAAIYGTIELEAGTPSQGFTPYVGYEPFAFYAGAFQQHLLTLHNVSAGVRRAWGPTFLDVYLRRKEASIDIAERWSVGTTVSHTIGIGGSAFLNLRGEAEFRRYDRFGGEDRRDFRTRGRARLIVPLDPAVDLQVTADVQRLRSSLDGFSTINVIVGPTLVARFGF